MKKFNTILEFDEIGHGAYIYIPPYSHKNLPKVTRTEQIRTAKGEIYNFDWSDDTICGIEILDADRNLMLK